MDAKTQSKLYTETLTTAHSLRSQDGSRHHIKQGIVCLLLRGGGGGGVGCAITTTTLSSPHLVWWATVQYIALLYIFHRLIRIMSMKYFHYLIFVAYVLFFSFISDSRRSCSKVRGATLTTLKCTNVNMAHFPQFRKLFKFHTCFDICEKLLTKSKIFEIRKVLPGSLFMPKIFEMKFWSLHHFGIWFKR